MGSFYEVSTATRSDGSTVPVILTPAGDLHEASGWTEFLVSSGYSPNTVWQYARRLAAFLGWMSHHTDWKNATVSHVIMWRNFVAQSPKNGNGSYKLRRKASTVRLWIIPIRSFYVWAEATGVVKVGLADDMSELRYFPAGAPGAGEQGIQRRVLSSTLDIRDNEIDRSTFKWIDDQSARNRLRDLHLPIRDRLLIDLFCNTGIRAGEALSLFINDMHFGGGEPALGCRIVQPHFHVRLDNPVQNGARAKGGARTLYVSQSMVDRYIDYMIARSEVIGPADMCPHVFVNLHNPGGEAGTAMSYAGVRKLVSRCGKLIDFPLTGAHIFRHTFATCLVRGIEVDPVALDVVQELLGHRSIDSTRIYTHDSEKAMRKALGQLQTRKANIGVNI